jgi:hypothetical protein
LASTRAPRVRSFQPAPCRCCGHPVRRLLLTLIESRAPEDDAPFQIRPATFYKSKAAR